MYTENTRHLNEELCELRVKVDLVQEKYHKLSVANTHLIEETQNVKLIIQTDQILKYVSLVSSTILFGSNLTNLAFTAYNYYQGGNNSQVNLKELSNKINFIYNIISNFQQNRVRDTASERAISNSEGI